MTSSPLDMAYHYRRVPVPEKWSIPTVPVNGLCKTCADKLWPALWQRRDSLAMQGIKILSFDEYVDLKCLACWLIATLLQSLPESSTGSKQLRLLQRTTQNTKLQKEVLLSYVPQLAFVAVQGTAGGVLGENDFRTGLLNGVIAPAPQPHKTSFPINVRRVNAVLQNEDYELIKSWLEYCEYKHGGSCRVESLPQLPPDFKCIDVYSRRVTHIAQGEKYFALSWVEGKRRNVPLIRRQDGIFVPILHDNPVEDAIRAVKCIGGTYLWVFQCSVPRHHPEVKRSMLKHMDSIYENAIATIIAAPDKVSSNRLPGIGRGRLIQQPALRIGNVTLLSTLPHASKVLETTEWITRAWTYQEGILSRRMLLFTDCQVYFACAGMTCCESIERDVSTYVPTLEGSDHRLEMLGVKLNHMTNTDPTSLYSLFLHLHRYKGRDLRLQKNTINAFRGILSRSSFKDIWGVPVAFRNPPTDPTLEELTIAFMRGLWWENPYYSPLEGNVRHDIFSRVPEYPSWSWAGWQGGKNRLHAPPNESTSDCNPIKDNRLGTVICLDVTPDAHRNLRGRISLIDWWQEVNARELKLSHVLHIEAASFMVRIRLDGTVPYICSCPPEAECRGHGKHSEKKRRVRFFEATDVRTPLNLAIEEHLLCAVLLFEISLSEEQPSYATWIIDPQTDSSKPTELKGVTLLTDDTIPIMDVRRSNINIG